MTSKKTARSSPRPRRTAIVPRVVFQTVVAVSVVPAVGMVAGCGTQTTVADAGRDAGFSVADSGPPYDAGRDAGFSVADVGPPNDAAFSVAVELDSGFSVAVPFDGAFSVAIPLDGAFAVLAFPGDGSTNT